MAQPQELAARADAMLSQSSPQQRQAAIGEYWQSVVMAMVSGNVLQQQVVAAVAPVIRKYDPQYDAHLQEATRRALALSASGMGSGSNMTMPSFGDGGGGGRSAVCPICNGSGSCKICKGTGTFRSNGYSSPCDRKCSACGGTGRR